MSGTLRFYVWCPEFLCLMPCFSAATQRMLLDHQVWMADGFACIPWDSGNCYQLWGTVHTAVREPYFTLFSQDGFTMARWLFDAVNGNVYDVGMDLL